jgi:hypothetical protein
MTRVYDAFEVLPEGRLVWSATVVGDEDAIKKLEKAAKDSRNECRLMRIPSNAVIAKINSSVQFRSRLVGMNFGFGDFLLRLPSSG